MTRSRGSAGVIVLLLMTSCASDASSPFLFLHHEMDGGMEGITEGPLEVDEHGCVMLSGTPRLVIFPPDTEANAEAGLGVSHPEHGDFLFASEERLGGGELPREEVGADLLDFTWEDVPQECHTPTVWLANSW